MLHDGNYQNGLRMTADPECLFSRHTLRNSNYHRHDMQAIRLLYAVRFRNHHKDNQLLHKQLFSTKITSFQSFLQIPVQDLFDQPS